MPTAAVGGTPHRRSSSYSASLGSNGRITTLSASLCALSCGVSSMGSTLRSTSTDSSRTMSNRGTATIKPRRCSSVKIFIPQKYIVDTAFQTGSPKHPPLRDVTTRRDPRATVCGSAARATPSGGRYRTPPTAHPPDVSSAWMTWRHSGSAADYPRHRAVCCGHRP